MTLTITIPTLITFVRIGLIPFIIGALVHQQWYTACGLFIIAALTDVLDGSLARLLGKQSWFGAALDPIADKLLILSVFFTFAFVKSPRFIMPHWFFWIMFFKEVLIISGAALLFSVKGTFTIKPTWLGKLTTMVQAFFITWIFACYFFHWLPLKTYTVFLVVVVCLVLVTLLHYVRYGLRIFYE
jgi:cardiolipin synthase